MSDQATIRQLPTGVPGLDEVLGGGLPEFSFNVVAGAPGAGKTTLAQQIVFGLASPSRRAIYFTVMGEPPLKMLRYQQQFGFFDAAKIGTSLRMANLAGEAARCSLDELLQRIVAEVEAYNPGIVVVDSFRSIVQAAAGRGEGEAALQAFVQQLALRLTSWQATTFLIGEYLPSDAEHNPVFTVADGLLWLYQSVDRNSMVRKLQVIKSRGHAAIPGLHTFRISQNGIQVFPRMILPAPTNAPESRGGAARPRVRFGVTGLDEMLGGGVPAGNSVLLVGPSGAGKTVLATEFIARGAEMGEPGIIAVFEKRPMEFGGHAPSGAAISRLVTAGKVKLIHTRPLDLSIDEMLHELTNAIRETGAKRLVIDSLNGFEMALAPTFREDFRESLYRMVAMLTGLDITLLMTAELEDSFTDLRFSPHGTAFLADVILMQRYIEINGRLERAISVVKVRACQHSNELRRFSIGEEGVRVGEPLAGYQGLLSGRPERISPGPGLAPKPEAAGGGDG